MELPRTPSFNVTGQRALVTGAGRGIGLAAAVALADAGAEVTLAARSRDEIEAAAAEIVARGGRARALVLDVLDVTTAAAVIAASGAVRHPGQQRRDQPPQAGHRGDGRRL